MPRGQIQPYLREEFPDPASDLDETEPQGVQLHPPPSACHQLPPQSVHQPVGASVQKQSELVGDEPMAAQTVRLYVELEVLDPVLALSPSGVELVKILRFVVSRGEDEAGVGPLLHRLGLVDHPALVLPACCLVATFTEKLHLLAFVLVALLGLG